MGVKSARQRALRGCPEGGVRASFVAALLAGSMASLAFFGCRRPAPPPRGDAGSAGPAAAGDASGTSASTGTALPADFPRDIPVYAGAEVAFAAKSTKQGRSSWTVTLETGDAKERAVDFYKAHMGGLKLATCMDMGETSMCVWQGRAYDATLMATAEANRTTTLTLTATEK